MKKHQIRFMIVAAVFAVSSLAGTAFAGGNQKLNNAETAFNVGKAAFSATTHAIGTAPKSNPVTLGYGLGKAAVGLAHGVYQGAKYQDWQKPQVISAAEGARTIGYTAGVLGHRAYDAVKAKVTRR